MTIVQLMAHSRAEDRLRSQEVRHAIVQYVDESNIVNFRVPATGRSGKAYQVRVRLEEWKDHATDLAVDLKKTYIDAVKAAVNGRVSFDCSCGRHQYWYRYLASIGNFAVEPTESGFPKIRNPNLTGCCCKHVLKALKTLQGAAVIVNVATLMQRQAAFTQGFESKRALFLNEKQVKTVTKSSARSRLLSDPKLKAAYKKAQKMMSQFQKQAKPYDLKPSQQSRLISEENKLLVKTMLQLKLYQTKGNHKLACEQTAEELKAAVKGLDAAQVEKFAKENKLI